MMLCCNAITICLENCLCNYPVLSVHKTPKTVYQTHATTNVSTTKLQFYHDRAMVNQKRYCKRKGRNSMIEVTSYIKTN